MLINIDMTSGDLDKMSSGEIDTLFTEIVCSCSEGYHKFIIPREPCEYLS